MRRRQRHLAAVAAAGLAAAVSPASAQQISGNELYEACQSDNTGLAAFCTGYIIGQVEGQSFGAFVVLNRVQPAENAADINDRINFFLSHCTPGAASNEQLRDTVLKHLRENPETRHDPARFEVWRALIGAFSC